MNEQNKSERTALGRDDKVHCPVLETVNLLVATEMRTLSMANARINYRSDALTAEVSSSHFNSLIWFSTRWSQPSLSRNCASFSFRRVWMAFCCARNLAILRSKLQVAYKEATILEWTFAWQNELVVRYVREELIPNPNLLTNESMVVFNYFPELNEREKKGVCAYKFWLKVQYDPFLGCHKWAAKTTTEGKTMTQQLLPQGCWNVCVAVSAPVPFQSSLWHRSTGPAGFPPRSSAGAAHSPSAFSPDPAVLPGSGPGLRRFAAELLTPYRERGRERRGRLCHTFLAQSNPAGNNVCAHAQNKKHLNHRRDPGKLANAKMFYSVFGDIMNLSLIY